MSKIKLYKFNFNLTDDKKDSILFAYNEESFQIVSKRFLFKLDTGWKRVSSKNRKRLGINISWNAITEEFHIKSLLKAELIIDGVVIKGVYPHLDAASPKHPSYEGLQNGILESLRGIRVYFLIKSINMASLEFKTDSAAGHRIIDTLATMQSYK